MDTDKSKLIDALATEYVKTNRLAVLNELAKELLLYARWKARYATWKAKRTGVYIPLEDFESNFLMAVMDAAKTYDPKKGHFIGRLNYLISRCYEPAVWRKYATKKSDSKSNGSRYMKANMDSLDRVIDAENGSTLGEAVLIQHTSAEEQFMNSYMIEKILNEFCVINKHYGNVIVLIHKGVTNEELALIFGEREYNVRIRKLVQRAKKSFRNFVDTNQACTGLE
jgi:hypothetical protein